MRQSLRDFVTLHLIVAGKIVVRVLSNRLIPALGGWPPPRKSVWRMKGHGIVDMFFATRLLREQRQEQNKDLYITIVDLTMARDTVSCEDPWRIMATCGCLDKFMSMARKFHDAMVARVLD